MEVRWCAPGNFWYIAVDEKITDVAISYYLDLTIEEWRGILISLGGQTNYNDQEIIWINKADAQAAITAIEPLYILTKLTH